VSILLLVFAAIALVFAINGIRPPMYERSAVIRPPWMPVMLTNEFAPMWAVLLVVVTLVAVWLGAASSTIGRVGIGFALIALLLFGLMIARSAWSFRDVSAALAGIADVPPPALRWRSVFLPYPYVLREGIERVEDLAYAPDLFLDIYRSTQPSIQHAPLLIHIHGGSWGGGNRRQMSQPLIQEMADRGWIVVSVDYPLVPAATFPDQMNALHGALRWLRDSADGLGVDPSSIFVTGGSAGGHLAALVALTDRDSDWSTRRDDEEPIAGAVVAYGVFDLLDRNGIRDFWPIVTDRLIKADPVVEPEKFRLGSPIDHVGPEAPPFLVVHGANDSLVPIVESEHFVTALRAISERPVAFARIRGATHAFDAVDSLRTQNTVAGIAAFLEAVARTP
jgi:acetyl esterase/lipase